MHLRASAVVLQDAYGDLCRMNKLFPSSISAWVVFSHDSTSWILPNVVIGNSPHHVRHRNEAGQDKFMYTVRGQLLLLDFEPCSKTSV